MIFKAISHITGSKKWSKRRGTDRQTHRQTDAQTDAHQNFEALLHKSPSGKNPPLNKPPLFCSILRLRY